MTGSTLLNRRVGWLINPSAVTGSQPINEENLKVSDNEKKTEALTSPVTLTDEDMNSQSAVGRRSVLAGIGATVLGATATSIGGCFVSAQPQQGTVQTTVAQPAVVQGSSGLTDRDSGSIADPAGNGRGGYRGIVTGVTDGDSGYYSDPAGQGRGARFMGSTGITDRDSGSWADPAGNGRGGLRGFATGFTDGDSGTYSDPAGQGRGHR